MKTNRLNEEELVNVCGADYGDAAKDNNSNSSMYSVGESVELYVDPCHIWTQNKKILDKRFVNGKWEYEFEDWEVSPETHGVAYKSSDWCNANAIQSK